MLKILIRLFQVGVFVAIVLLASQIPVEKDAKGHVKRVYNYVAEFTDKGFIQTPLHWAGSKFDFAAGHGFRKALVRKGRHAVDKGLDRIEDKMDGNTEDTLDEHAQLSGLLKKEQSRSDTDSSDDESNQNETDTE